MGLEVLLLPQQLVLLLQVFKDLVLVLAVEVLFFDADHLQEVLQVSVFSLGLVS